MWCSYLLRLTTFFWISYYIMVHSSGLGSSGFLIHNFIMDFILAVVNKVLLGSIYFLVHLQGMAFKFPMAHNFPWFSSLPWLTYRMVSSFHMVHSFPMVSTLYMIHNIYLFLIIPLIRNNTMGFM